MIRIAVFCLSLFLVNVSFAQMANPISWSWTATPAGKGEYKLTFTARIDAKWHTYSQFIAEGGPVKTSLTFDEKNKDIQLVGKAAETSSKPHSGHDPVFDMDLKYFENDLTLVQIVKVTKDTRLKGSIEWMACDDKMCMPPVSKEFDFDLRGPGK